MEMFKEKVSRKETIYCEHTEPRRYKALHYDPSEDSVDTEEETIEICGSKVSNKFTFAILSIMGVTLCWIVMGLRFIGLDFIQSEKNVTIEDHRCNLCKK